MPENVVLVSEDVFLRMFCLRGRFVWVAFLSKIQSPHFALFFYLFNPIYRHVSFLFIICLPPPVFICIYPKKRFWGRIYLFRTENIIFLVAIRCNFSAKCREKRNIPLIAWAVLKTVKNKVELFFYIYSAGKSINSGSIRYFVHVNEGKLLLQSLRSSAMPHLSIVFL